MKSPCLYYSVGSFAALAFASFVVAQSQPFTPSKEALERAKGSAAKTAHPGGFNKPQAPAKLPGNGLKQHDFFVSGVQSQRDKKGIVMVKNGQVVWNYFNPDIRGNYYDGTMLPNGNLLLGHANGVKIITPDKKIAWAYDVKPPARAKMETRDDGHEIDGVQPVGKDRVVFLRNGDPTAHIVVANITTGKIEKEVEIPVAKTANMKEARYVHMQMRRMRLTPQGTALVAYTNADKVAEYDENGKETWSAMIPRPWSVERLKNGHTLVTSMRLDTGTVELDAQGKTVWQMNQKDIEAQGYIIDKMQSSTRLANGNTIITVNNETAWVPGDTPEGDLWAPVQLIEVTPAKKIVWALRDWTNFDVVSTFQTLDDPRIKEPLRFGSFK
jgi:hypothetical protein